MAKKNAATILSLHCAKIAEEVADRHGFVSLRALAGRCRCQIVARPLLVEAGITKRLDGTGDWIVLVNDEIHPLTLDQIEYESHLLPISARTRNTIAHEIAHSVAIEVFGIDFSEASTQPEKLKDIEKSVERASPLLLVSGKMLLKRLESTNYSDSTFDALRACTEVFGLSRNALFNNFRHHLKYSKQNSYIATPSLDTSSWGLAERKTKDKIVTRAYWLISNYHGPVSSPYLKHLSSDNTIEWHIRQKQDYESHSVLHLTRTNKQGANENVVIESEVFGKKSRTFFFRIPHAQSLNNVELNHTTKSQ